MYFAAHLRPIKTRMSLREQGQVKEGGFYCRPYQGKQNTYI